jgi:hypothetical protein
MQPRDDDPTATERIFCDREKKAHRGLEDDGGRRERGRLAQRRVEARDALVSDGAELPDRVVANGAEVAGGSASTAGTMRKAEATQGVAAVTTWCLRRSARRPQTCMQGCSGAETAQLDVTDVLECFPTDGVDVGECRARTDGQLRRR